MNKGQRIHKNKLENWIVYFLILSGISILTTPIWKDYVDSVLTKYFALIIPKPNLWTGWILLILGIGFYLINTFKKNLIKPKKVESKIKIPNFLDSTIINRDFSRDRKIEVNSFLVFVEELLIKDQIKETGAWGFSQRKILELESREISDKEIQEGGIISTFIAVRALKHRKNFNNNCDEFKLALKYLLERQHKSGGFGRKYYSRSGAEIKPSYRHTALSIIQLILLDGPPDNISEAVEYLKNYRIKDIVGDTSPSVAISTVLLVFELLISEGGNKYLSSSQIKELVSIYERDKQMLIKHIISESKDITNKYSPYFVPYGRTEEMLYDTALTTIDFLSYLSSPPLDLIINILNQIRLECVDLGAVPYNQEIKTPDIGMSIYYYVLCNRKIIREAIEKKTYSYEIMRFANTSMDFVIDNYQSKNFVKYTYADTLGNALLLKI